MKANYLGLFNQNLVDNFSGTPKYLQLVNFLLDAVESGKIAKGQLLPSINELSFKIDVSKDTVEKAYREMKKIGVLASHPGKGYFIIQDDFLKPLKIVLFFNKLSAHKKIIYDSFIKEIGQNVAVDFFIYNNDYLLFKKILSTKLDAYSHYVIIPHFLDKFSNTNEVINSIPKEKLIILDKLIPGIDGEYGAVYENFEKDIYEALEKALEPLKKYHTLNLVFPKDGYFPREITRGFFRFCQEYAFESNLLNDAESAPMQKGEAFIILMEDDLVRVAERIIGMGFTLGTDAGIISYNETPIKKLILNGITTVSTDFAQMGISAARLILNKSKEHIENPFYLNLRASL